MKAIVATGTIVFLLVMFMLAQRAYGEETKGFDYYLLSLSWSPEFCQTHKDTDECTVPRTFILHGLWPQYEDGGYPHSCHGERVPEAVIQDIMPIMPNRHLIIHEWQKHGTCTGLDPSTYFANAQQAFDGIAIPDVFMHPTKELTMSTSQIVDAFKKANPGLEDNAMQVVCPGEELSEVRFCLSKDGKTRACGEIGNSCHSEQVNVVAPHQ